MAGPNVRVEGDLKIEAASYAASLGVSLNALVAVALRDYLDSRKWLAPPGDAGGRMPPPPRREPSLPPPVQAPASSQPSLPAAALPRVGRNDPCPCGSGRKAKICHQR